MSRHRDVRTMKYSDEYDGYDDVYGHSVEDDYCVSPGAEQFMFDRNKQQNMASYFTEPDIKEDNEDDDEACATPKKPELSEIDTARLVSCIDIIRNVIGDSISEAELTEKIIKADFNAEVALDEILKNSPQKNQLPAAVGKERSESQTGSSGSSLQFTNPLASQLKFSLIPNKSSPFKNPFSAKNSESPPKFGGNKSPGVKPDLKFSSLSALIANHSDKNVSPSLKVDKKPFGTLADLTKNHLQNSGNSSSKTSSFFIPKLSLNSSDPISCISPLKVKIEGEKKKIVEERVQTLAKDLVHMQISPEIDLQDKKIDNLEHNPKDSVADNSKEQTSNDFLIDLTTALRQTNILSVIEKKNPEQLNKYDLKDIYMMTAEPLPSSMIVESLDNLKQCEINLSKLQFAKLSHANDSNVSLFGKMLCRRWRPRKPYVKTEPKSHGKLKIFDFTSPSPDNLILANLRRN